MAFVSGRVAANRIFPRVQPHPFEPLLRSILSDIKSEGHRGAERRGTYSAPVGAGRNC